MFRKENGRAGAEGTSTYIPTLSLSGYSEKVKTVKSESRSLRNPTLRFQLRLLMRSEKGI
jgi:hypothetical protein